MKFLFFSALCLLSPLVSAQLTLTVADFATASDTVRFSQAPTQSIDYTSTGPNSNWDFSQLTAISQSLKEYKPVGLSSLLILATFGPIASTPYRATYFNTSTELPINQLSSFLPIDISNLNQYTKRANAAITSLGFSIDVQGQGVPFKSDTIETRYALPLTFNDTYTSRGYTFVDLNPAADIKFVQHRGRTTVVDGYGTITTPLGTFQALRLHHQIQEVDSLYQTFFGSGTWIGLPAQTRSEYEWWTNAKDEYLLKVVVSGFGANQNVTSIEYQDHYLGLDAGLTELQSKVAIYPNPVQDWCFFEAPQEVTRIDVINMFGQILWQLPMQTRQGYFDISALPTGTYSIQLHTAQGKVIKKLTKL
ncbi:MAG: hypothetical protein RLZZ301_1170 [Bacteroidota bacterium]|jgi:hypothetical protein